jgi:hypothetical protein
MNSGRLRYVIRVGEIRIAHGKVRITSEGEL